MRAAIALLMLPLLAAPLPVHAEDARFMLCEALPHQTCVWSGDSFYLRGRIVRLADAVAPERYTGACPRASQLSWRSALRLRDLLNGGAFEIADPDGAELTVVSRNGQSLGEQMIAEGLARPRAPEAPNWCG
jgi:endonuclease YncB( thermonuclease family)